MRLTRALLASHFGDIWPAHNRAFTALLVTCRRCLDGDLDQMLILSAMGERALTAQRTTGLSYRAFLDGDRRGPTKAINVQSIADSTGIPRETVRRKVAALIERGWVTRNADDTLEVTATAVIELAPATQATFDYFLALGNALASLPAEQPVDAGTGPRQAPARPEA
jgi:hypothetical protein